MSGENTAWDGMDRVIGQDADTHPSYLPAEFVEISVNRVFRGGLNRTRPPFSELILKPADPENTSIVNDYETGLFQGCMPYRSIKLSAVDGVVVSVSGVIYFIAVINNVGYISKLMEGNNPTLMNAWFVQAEDWVYIQNDEQNPIAWNGDLSTPAIRLNPEAKQMPIGNIMAYCQGRVFVADSNNNIFASDIIFGNGFTDTSNTQNFTETDYWQEGGSFTPPSALGGVTGMYVMPALNINTRGQGELVIYCEYGAFTLDVSIDRAAWKDSQMQRVSLIGRGCLSASSITGVNNNNIYRAADGWAFYSNSQTDFNNSFSFRKISREVNRWVMQDTPFLIQFASGIFFDNRFIGTVSPYTVRKEGGGLHRPHRGMIVLDLDQTTQTSPDAALNFRWNGIWTGPQVTQLIKGNIKGVERAFAFSFEADGKNHIFEFSLTGKDDFVGGALRKIRSLYIPKRFDFSSSQKTNKFLVKQLEGGDFWLSGMVTNVTVSVEYRPDSSPCWAELLPEINLLCPSCGPSVSNCAPFQGNARYKQLIFSTPKWQCIPGGNTYESQGAEFQIRVIMDGYVSVDRLRLRASIPPDADRLIGDCDTDLNMSCNAVSCCSVLDFDLYKIIE